MTKYALLTEFAPPDHGGIQASVGPIIDALGSELTVMSPQQAIGTSPRVVRSLFSGRSWPRWWWLVSWLRQGKQEGLVTVIFGHFSAATIAGLIAKKFFGLSYVILVHGNDILFEQRRWTTKFFIGSVLRNAKYIGVNSNFVQQIVSNYGVAQVKISFTHPFVLEQDIPEFQSRSEHHRLITIARLVKRKNVAQLLHAVVEMNKSIPDVHLDVVGDGPERKNLEQLAQELHISQHVTFHGNVEDKEKWKLLAQANIFVLTPTVERSGTDVEGLGLVYLEAAAAGLPIVASSTGGVSDAVINEATGLLVNPNNAVAIAQACLDLIQDTTKAQKFGLAGRERVMQEFTNTVRLKRCIAMLKGVSEQPLPLVSLIIPAYNSADTIDATLRSVQQQTWKNIEIIVVDDGSTDDLASALQPHLFNITLIKQKNAGAPVARNNGFAQSAGKYVLFLDADTRLEPTAIEKMVTTLELHPEYTFVYSDFYFGWKKFHLFEYSSMKLRQQNYIHTSSLLRREDFLPFDPILKKFQDWDLWLTLDLRGKRGVWIPEVLFRVTERARGIGMSTWLPSFVYRLPLIGQGHGNVTIAQYRQAEDIIRKKHRL